LIDVTVRTIKTNFKQAEEFPDSPRIARDLYDVESKSEIRFN